MVNVVFVFYANARGAILGDQLGQFGLRECLGSGLDGVVEVINAVDYCKLVFHKSQENPLSRGTDHMADEPSW